MSDVSQGSRGPLETVLTRRGGGPVSHQDTDQLRQWIGPHIIHTGLGLTRDLDLMSHRPEGGPTDLMSSFKAHTQ